MSSRYHNDGRMKAEFLLSPVEVSKCGDGWVVEDFVNEKEYCFSSEEDAYYCASRLEDGYMEEWDE